MTAPRRRRALVTGGSGAIGAAICRALAVDDVDVVVHANRNLEHAQVIARDIGNATAVAFDATDSEQVRAAVASLLEQGPIQIVVNNAGIHRDALMAGMNDSDWLGVIDANLNGFFRVTQPLLMPMVRTRWGRVINVTSVAAQAGNRGQSNYAASKAGVHGATKSLAREMAGRGITVNAVAPGIIDSEMSRSSFPPERISEMVPAGRAGRPEEVAALVAFLASDAAAYITGQIIGINGGLY